MELTEAQEGALHLMVHNPAYMADGTKINDNTGRALARRDLAWWSDAQQAWVPTEKGSLKIL